MGPKPSNSSLILPGIESTNLPQVESHSSISRCAGAYSVARPPAVFSNDLRSLHIVSKARLSIPHLLGGGGIFKCILHGGRRFFDTISAGKLHPSHTEKMIRP